MESFIQILISSAGIASGLVDVFSAFVTEWVNFPTAGDAVTLAFAGGAITYADISAEMLTVARRWHRTIDGRVDNIDNLIAVVRAHQSQWGTPPQFSQIVANYTELTALMLKCRSSSGSAVDRGRRNELLRMTVGLCLGQIKSWSFSQYYAGVMTINDVHSLGFLLPGESGGHRSRAEANRTVAEVKVSVTSADSIRVVIDRAAHENAASTAHGWPKGVRTALIVITSADGKTEVLRRYTSRLHNRIQMPDGSHGKQFVIKAAFLRHVDDDPLFGAQPTFSMPLTTEDLAIAVADRRQQEDFDLQLREIERLRLEVEQLKAAIAALTVKAASR
jgi:hypothetical protein